MLHLRGRGLFPDEYTDCAPHILPYGLGWMSTPASALGVPDQIGMTATHLSRCEKSLGHLLPRTYRTRRERYVVRLCLIGDERRRLGRRGSSRRYFNNHRLDVAGLDSEREVVIAITAERINHDASEAIPLVVPFGSRRPMPRPRHPSSSGSIHPASRPCLPSTGSAIRSTHRKPPHNRHYLPWPAFRTEGVWTIIQCP